MASANDLSNDQRFNRVTKDPRFWEMPEKDKKIKIDKRFRAMFDDSKFNLKYTVDKRGRPMNHSTVQDMKRFYDLADSDDSDTSKNDHAGSSQKLKRKGKKKNAEEIPGFEEPTSHRKLNILCKKDKAGAVQQRKLEKETDSIRKTTLKKDTEERKSTVDQIKGDLKQAQKEKNRSRVNKRKEPQVLSPKTVRSQKEKHTVKNESASVSDSVSAEETCDEPQPEAELLGCKDTSGSDPSDSGVTEEEDDEDSGEASEEAEGDSEELSEEGDSEDEDGEDSDSGPDLARGKGNVETSSEDEAEDDLAEIFPKEPEFEHAWGELDRNAPRGDEITNRLAVCNMDWDRLKAKDLMALFNSFKPKGGVVFSVKIYPSEFGKERMKKETVHGPVELKELPEDATDEQKVCREKLREYQFKRLKYFYAVVECDSPETANKIYEECDGLEFESSCSFVDLRFIPDEVTFNDEPKDVATDVDFTVYKPKYFTSAAMATSKVEITWDETDNDRLSMLNRTFKKDEILDMDFQAYLASSSEEEVEEEQQPEKGERDSAEDGMKSKKNLKEDDEQIAKYRELLRNIQEKDKKCEENDMEMEIKWVPGFKESAEKMVKNKLEGKDKLTPWEKYLQKKKEKRKLKKNKKDDSEDESSEDELPPDVDLSDPFFAEELAKPDLKKKSKKKKADIEHTASGEEPDVEKQKAEIALLMMDDDEDNRKHFNYEKIVEQQNLSKKKKKKLMKKKELLEDDFQINIEDTRFQAMYTSHLFNVDPSDPNFKKTKAMEKVFEEKVRRRDQEQANDTEILKKPEKEIEGKKQQASAKKNLDPALSMLIKSVKNKTEQFQARKKQKVV
ncbi:ESF1 homolog isoform X1 [Pleurodeles waltl]